MADITFSAAISNATSTTDISAVIAREISAAVSNTTAADDISAVIARELSAEISNATSTTDIALRILIDLLSTDIKSFTVHNGLLHIFSAAGVDLYRLSDWQRVMTASITATSGAVNNLGVFIGTAAGVYFLPHNLTGVQDKGLRLIFDVDTTAVNIQDNAVTSLAGYANDLLICTDDGADYLPDMDSSAVVHSYPDASGCDHAAINGTQIAYSVATGMHILNHPAADWDSGDATVLTLASSPAILSSTVQAMAFGTDLFIATDAGISVYDGANVTNFTATPLGTVVDVKAVWPASDATDSAGIFAYATSNDSDGGRFGIYNITTAANETTVSGDINSAWTNDDWNAAIYDGALDNYANFDYLSPAPDAQDVQRSWSLYAEITDSVGGLTADSVTLTVDGVSKSPTTTVITNGYRVEYTPSAASNYGQQHRIVLSATDADGKTITRAWNFRCAASLPEATTAPPPNVVVAKDINLTAAESDEELAIEKYVIWLPDKTHPLIVTDAQAETVGTVIVDGNTCHRHRRTLLVDRLDTNSDAVADLQEGALIAFTATAIGETTKKAQVIASRQIITQQDGVQYRLLVQYYEAV